MKTIWKYPLHLCDSQSIAMHAGAQVLTVQPQGSERQLQVWALVDPEADKVERFFRIYGTGHEMSDDPGHYVGTFQIHDGALVFHVFDSETPT